MVQTSTNYKMPTLEELEELVSKIRNNNTEETDRTVLDFKTGKFLLEIKNEEELNSVVVFLKYYNTTVKNVDVFKFWLDGV